MCYFISIVFFSIFFNYSTVPGSFDKGTNFHLAANKAKRSKGGLGIHFQDLNKKNDRYMMKD